MKSRVKASERAVAGERLLGLVEEEDQESGLEINILALSLKADALLPRPLLFCQIYPLFPYPWTDGFCLVISPQMLLLFFLVGILVVTLDPRLIPQLRFYIFCEY